MMQSLINDTKRGIRRLESKVDEYEEFISWLDSTKRNLDEFSSEERDAFEDAFSEYAKFADETVPEDQVTEIREELAEVLRQPAQRGLQEQTARVLNQFGVEQSAALTRSLEAEIQALDQNIIPSNRSLLQEVMTQGNELSQPAMHYVGDEIADNPNILLKLGPDDDHLLQLVETVLEREQKLEAIAASVKSYEWIEVTDRDFGPFANTWLSETLPDPDAVTSELDQLNEYRILFSQTIGDISPFLLIELDNMFSEPADGLVDPLTDLVASLETPANTVEKIKELNEAKEIAEEQEHQIPTQALVELSNISANETINNREELQDQANNLLNIYFRWTNEMISSWKSDAQILTNLSERFGINEPDVLNEIENMEALARRDPSKAVRQLESLHASLADLREDITDASGLEGDALDLLLDLIVEENVPISRYGIEAVATLNNKFDLEVAIDESVRD